MSLASMLSEDKHDTGTKRVRCPQCKEWIFVPIYVIDYIHHNCTTRDKFDIAKFTSEAWNLVGFKGIPPRRKAIEDQTIEKDATDDCSFEIGENETNP